MRSLNRIEAGNMRIIPVIDVRGGIAVHARRGQRSNYQPLRSRLCRSANPVQVVEAFLSVYMFPVIYIADLDAIEKTGNNNVIICELTARYPAVTFWIDRESRFVWRSLQHFAPGMPPIEISILKPAA